MPAGTAVNRPVFDKRVTEPISNAEGVKIAVLPIGRANLKFIRAADQRQVFDQNWRSTCSFHIKGKNLKFIPRHI